MQPLAHTRDAQERSLRQLTACPATRDAQERSLRQLTACPATRDAQERSLRQLTACPAPHYVTCPGNSAQCCKEEDSSLAGASRSNKHPLCTRCTHRQHWAQMIANNDDRQQVLQLYDMASQELH
eukprot:483193-Pelagomonas_calceolata.AAC.8